jgi:nitrile hydratase
MTDHKEAAEHAQSDYSVRAKALVSVLTKKNLVDPATMDAVVEFYETRVGPHIGAGLVARSWVDPEFRARLLADARAVAREEQLTGLQGTIPYVENTPVCTTSSVRCAPLYPWMLGLPPTWYCSGYRARAVDRAACWGIRRAGDDVEVRVWDTRPGSAIS